MKNVFGSLFFLIMPVLSTIVLAVDPTPLDMITTSCEGETMGMITGLLCPNQCYPVTFIICGTHPDGGYAARAYITEGGIVAYGGFQVQWSDFRGDWESGGGATIPAPSQCVQDWQNYIAGLTNEERRNPKAVFDAYFPPPTPESRLPWDDDLDGDGRPDRYDLDSPHYIDYLEYCRENDLDALDLQDYQYWYEHGLDEYLAARDQYYDSDLDGFSDGYEIIHDTDMNDAYSYPLGRPDMGTANQIMGGVDSPEPWRYEEYADGWSRGHVYDMGYDPYGDTPISVINEDFEGPPDWYGLDSSGDGINNGTKIELGQNPYEFNFQQGSHYVYDDSGGYWKYVGGVTDADFPFPDPPTLEEALEKYEEYVPDESGNYTYNPGTFEFGDAEYDARLQKFQKIKFDVDSVRPVSERDYQVHFNIPIPGGSETYTIAVVPDTGSPGGAALDNLRRIIRALSAVVISYVFVKHIWTVIRQY